MALNKLKYNSLNVTPAASKAIRFDSGADGFETASAGGKLVKIKTLTASSSSTLSFVDGASSVVLDNTYKEYLFTFNNIHPSAAATFTFNVSIDSGSNYNVAKTSTFFMTQHDEGDTETSLSYDSDKDLAQGTGFQSLDLGSGTDNDNNLSGYLQLFDPASTTFVKHFMTATSCTHSQTYANHTHVAGYANTTSAVDAVQFKMSTGDIDAGTITLYGVS